MTGVALAALGIGVAVYVLAPLRRPDAAEAERVGAAESALRDAHSRHEQILAALRDLEDDRATAKVGDDDYASMRAQLTAQAVEIMQRIDELEERQRDPAPRAVRDDAGS